MSCISDDAVYPSSCTLLRLKQLLIKDRLEVPSMVVHICNTSTWKDELQAILGNTVNSRPVWTTEHTARPPVSKKKTNTD
jgi:hypothetical protein